MDNRKISVSREEIENLKSSLRRAGLPGYARIAILAQQKAVEPGLNSISGTKRLLRLSRVFGWAYPLLMLTLPPAVLLVTPWWVGLGLVVVLLLLVNFVHSEINLEVGARLVAASRRMKFFDE